MRGKTYRYLTKHGKIREGVFIGMFDDDFWWSPWVMDNNDTTLPELILASEEGETYIPDPKDCVALNCWIAGEKWKAGGHDGPSDEFYKLKDYTEGDRKVYDRAVKALQEYYTVPVMRAIQAFEQTGQRPDGLFLPWGMREFYRELDYLLGVKIHGFSENPRVITDLNGLSMDLKLFIREHGTIEHREPIQGTYLSQDERAEEHKIVQSLDKGGNHRNTRKNLKGRKW